MTLQALINLSLPGSGDRIMQISRNARSIAPVRHSPHPFRYPACRPTLRHVCLKSAQGMFVMTIPLKYRYQESDLPCDHLRDSPGTCTATALHSREIRQACAVKAYRCHWIPGIQQPSPIASDLPPFIACTTIFNFHIMPDSTVSSLHTCPSSHDGASAVLRGSPAQ